MNWTNYFLRLLPWYLAAEWAERRRRPSNVVPIGPGVSVRRPSRLWRRIRLAVELFGWLTLGLVLLVLLIS